MSLASPKRTDAVEPDPAGLTSRCFLFSTVFDSGSRFMSRASVGIRSGTFLSCTCWSRVRRLDARPDEKSDLFRTYFELDFSCFLTFSLGDPSFI